MKPPVPALTVVYAKDIGKVAAFYQRTLCLALIEADPGFVLVGDAHLEIAVVRMSETRARETQVSRPPQVREDTALKFSFLVDDFARVHREAVAAGGGTKRVAAAWSWRGQLHLDGYDPEGNVVQFRMPQA
jgi:predicted enzyme related to lactoylglutathione lyase